MNKIRNQRTNGRIYLLHSRSAIFFKNFKDFFFKVFFFFTIFKAFSAIFQRFLKHFLKEIFFRDFSSTLFFFLCVKLHLYKNVLLLIQAVNGWLKVENVDASHKIEWENSLFSAENRKKSQKMLFLKKKFRTFIKNGTRTAFLVSKIWRSKMTEKIWDPFRFSEAFLSSGWAKIGQRLKRQK